MSKKRIEVWLPVAFAVVLATGMWLGTKLQLTHNNRKKAHSTFREQKLEELFEYIRLRYVDTVNFHQLEEHAARGVLKRLDPHSVYISAPRVRQSNEVLQGNFEGIGIEFFIVNDTIMVVTPISGGPSDKLGIQAGDRIVRIEGKGVAGIGIGNRDVVKSLRGEKGTAVTVGIRRPGVEEILEFTIVRDEIPLHSVDVSYMVDDSIGYIKISRFTSQTYQEFRQALETLMQKGMEALMLDLRGNPGGFLSAATRVTDEFLPKEKLIVYTEGRSQPRQNYYSRGKGRFEKGELVVLIDRGSASASEILAGAIQDWGRGAVVGRRSFGKGLVQEQYTFHDSSAVRLTIARYYTPTGRCIQKPYKQGNRAYYNEIIERFRRGELAHEDSILVNDSLRFVAPSGKVVYGGGGIMPDVFVGIDTSGQSAYFNKIWSRGLIPQFAYSYVSRNRPEMERYGSPRYFKSLFDVEDKALDRFIAYASQQGVAYDDAGFRKSGGRIKTLLKAYMAKQLWESEGFNLIYQEVDKEFRVAYDILRGRQAVTDVTPVEQ